MAKKYIVIICIVIVLVLVVGLAAIRRRQQGSVLNEMENLLNEADESINQSGQAMDDLDAIDENEDNLTNVEKELESPSESNLPSSPSGGVVDVSGLDSLISAADKLASDVAKAIGDFDAVDATEDSEVKF